MLGKGLSNPRPHGPSLGAVVGNTDPPRRELGGLPSYVWVDLDEPLAPLQHYTTFFMPTPTPKTNLGIRAAVN